MPPKFVRKAAVGATLIVVCVVSVAATLSDNPDLAVGSGACRVPTPGTFAGAPPTWVVPAGGQETVVTRADGTRVCTIERADGSLFGRAFTDISDRPLRIEYYDEKSRIFYDLDILYPGFSDSARALLGSGNPDRCSSPQTPNPESVQWEFSPINWKLNTASFPSTPAINLTTLVTHARNAHAEWENNTNYCGIADNSALDFNYSGTDNRPRQKDNVNIVVHAEAQPDCTSSAIGCESTWFSVLTGKAIESDIVLDDDALWTTNPTSYPARYDIWNVTAHEVGHRALFGHVSDSRQVMYTNGAFTGDTIQRQLSRGDANGNNTKY